MKTKNILKSTFGTVASIAIFSFASQAQAALLTATVGSASSYAFNDSDYAPSKLFDGTPTVGTTNGLGNEFASNGEEDPVVTFDLGSLATLTGIDFAERQDAQSDPSDGGADGVAAIDLYFVSKSTYDSFTPTAGSTPTTLALALGTPSEVITIPTEPQTQAPGNPNTPADNGDTVIPTSLAFNNYSFTAADTEYVIAQFVGVDQAPMGIPANPGGAELRFVGTVIPEPGTYALLGLGLAGLVVTMRRRGSLKG